MIAGKKVFGIIFSALVLSLFHTPRPARAAAPTILNLAPDKTSVGRYQKIEWAFDLSKSYPNPYYYFDSTDTAQSNPATMTWHGVDGISVDLNLTSPSGKQLKVPAFWYTDYLRVRNSTFEILGKKSNGRWQARFAPSEIGTYRYSFTATDKDGSTTSPAGTFSAVASTDKGFVRTNTQDARFLGYSDGSSFVPISSGRQWWESSSLRSYDYEDAFSVYGQNGVNLLRIWDHSDFALGVEGTQPVWIRQGFTNAGAALGTEINTPNVYQGLRSAKPATGSGWFQRLAVAEPTRPHTLTAMLKVDAGSSVEVQIRTGTSFNSGTKLGGVSSDGTTTWKQFTTSFTPANQVVVINLIKTGGTGNVYVDTIDFGPTDTIGKTLYNIVSDSDFERHFAKDTSGNDPNSTPTLPRPLGNYFNPWAAYELDKIVESAQANGVKIQLCSCSGPWFTWPTNPDVVDYSQAWVLKSWQRNIRYRIARWGYSPAILAWEMYNEHGTINTGTNIYTFYQNYGNYITQTDPYAHLRTTSQGSQVSSSSLWSSPAMDLGNYHDYMMISRYPAELTNDAANFTYRFAWCLRHYGAYCQGLNISGASASGWSGSPKPWVWGEQDVGTSTWDQPNPKTQNGDGRLRFLHNSMWAGLMSPLGTTPIDWYTTSEDSNTRTQKYAQRKAAAAFWAGVDYGGGAFSQLMTATDTPPGYAGDTISSSNSAVRVYGLRRSDKQAVYLWVQNRANTWYNSPALPAAASSTVTIPGLLNQTYSVQHWNTYTGQIVSTQNLTAANSTLSLTISGLQSDVAYKIESTTTPPSTPVPTQVISPSATATAAPTAGATITPIPTSGPAIGNGDVDGNGQVNTQDIRLVISNWNTANTAADQYADGKINSFDLAVVIAHILVPTAAPTSPPTLTPSGPTPTALPSAGEWTQFGANAQHTSFSSQSVATPWRLKWQWNGAGADGKKQAGHLSSPDMVQPVTGGNRVYMVAGNAVYALDKNSTIKNGGTVLWTKTGIGTLSATPVYDSDNLYVPSSTGIYKLNAATGATLTVYTGGTSNLAPTLVGNNLYIVTPAGVLQALLKSTLVKSWEYAAGSPGQTPATYSSNGGGVLVFITQDLFVHAVNTTGNLRWKSKPTPRTPGNPGSSSGNSFAESTEGWPVMAEQHGLVFIRYRLDWNSLWTANPFPTTNSAIRAHLDQDPLRQALFALWLDTGVKAFTPAVGNGGAGDGGNLPMGSQPVVKTTSDGKEVAYIIWRNGLTCGGCATAGSCGTQWCDGREDATMGEMVLDSTTVTGYTAGDVRFVKFIDIQTDEMMNLSMAGDTLFHSHWLINAAQTITNRAANLGNSFTNPIQANLAPQVIWRQCSGTNVCNYPGCTGNTYCGSSCTFNSTSRYCTDLYSYGDARAYNAGFYEYLNDINGGTTPFTVISSGQVLVKTNDGAVMAFETGNPLTDAGSHISSNQVLGSQIAIAPTTPISWSQVKNYLDQQVTVTGKVVTIENHLPKAVYFGFTPDIHDTFLFRVFAKDLGNFNYDLSTLQDKTVSVTGVATVYWPDGAIPEIIVTDPSQLVVD